MTGDEEIIEKALLIRQWIIKMVHAAGCGHPGGALGLADIFAVLYFDVLQFRSKDPFWPGRDRLILSNGHVCAVRYAAMALAGIIPIPELMTFRAFGSRLQGHPSSRYLPEIENSSGSLGQGLSVAVGLTLGARLQNRKYKVYCSISDGECGEGMIWEAATAAVHYHSPIIAFMDYNGIQIDGFTHDVCDLGDLEQKFSSFGWRVLSCDGHNIRNIRKVFKNAVNYKSGPQMIIFKTILGRGVSFMENNPAWHGVAPDNDKADMALSELR